MQDRKDLKALIYQVAAATDRGQRMNAMIAPMYQNKLVEMSKDCDGILTSILDKIDKKTINRLSDKVFLWGHSKI